VGGADAGVQSADADVASRGRSGGTSAGKGPQAKAKARAASLQRVRVGDAPPPMERRDVGKVPVYLRKRQEEWAEQKRQSERTPSPQPPQGYRKVPDEERNGTLSVLQARKVEVEQAQRNLPFKIETVGQKQREKDLASRVADIDKLIGMFSKKVVFMPSDAAPIAASVPPLEDDALQGLPQETDSDRAVAQEVLHRPSSRGSAQQSRMSRAAVEAQQRREAGGGLPWDNFIMAEPPRMRQIKTEVKVSAPPGGKSTLQLY